MHHQPVFTSHAGGPSRSIDVPVGVLAEAAGRFGTPLYLYDISALLADARAIEEAFPDPWIRLVSLKANGLPQLLRHVSSLSLGASAVSRGEMSLAARAGFPPERTALEGIGKTTADLRAAVRLAQSGTPLLWVSLESAEEAAELSRMARRGPRIDVLVRINPRVQPETHRGLAVGASESKFGVLAQDLGDVVAAGGGPIGPLRWRGIHLHVGSQLGAVDAWRSAFRLGLRLLGLQRAALPDADTLDAGSGFPIGYDLTGEDSVPALSLFATAAREETAAIPSDARPRRLAIEPGRALLGRSGWLLGRVLHVRQRESPSVILDCGMTELLRPALYGAEHPIIALTSLGSPVDAGAALARVTVDGPICEATDRFGHFELPPLARGDLVAIAKAGAYGSSMSSRYNGRPRPAEVAWDGQCLELLRRRASERSLP